MSAPLPTISCAAMAGVPLAFPAIAGGRCFPQDWPKMAVRANGVPGPVAIHCRLFPAPCVPPGISCRRMADLGARCSTTSAAGTLQMEQRLSPGTTKGRPEPLGVQHERDGSVNFALFSKNAEKVVLCLYEPGSVEPSLEIDLKPSIHRTGDIWHVRLESLNNYTRYGYRCLGDTSWENGNRFHGRCVLLDPYAKHIAPFEPGQENLPSPALALGLLSRHPVPFDWEDDVSPRIPLHELVVHKINVHGYTSDISSKVEDDIRGTFMGVIQKADHLVHLGANAVILQPIFAFDESQGSYYPISFFALSPLYGPGGDSLSASTSFKQMVKELHRRGIEVILEVVYGHTAENGDDKPKRISLRGIDNATYYIVDQFGRVSTPDTGAENCLNCNHPIVTRMILDSLRHWIDEYHVDGFSFVNASALVTGPHGQELSRPPLVEAISFEPLLGGSKLIADTCSPISGACKDTKFPHWKRWCEWNFQFRNDVRRMIRGEPGRLSKFATRVCGSGDRFANSRGPSFSINFISSSFGLTLADLVSYSNAEDGDTELSWNCGEEGPTIDQAVLHTRVKQVGNFLMALFLAQGTPVLNMGDEYGYSKGGSTFLQDRECFFQWDALEADFGQQMTHLISSLVAFRSRRKDVLKQKSFVDPSLLSWHGVELNKPQWDVPESCFIAASLRAKKSENNASSRVGDLYMAFNAHSFAAPATLPNPPEGMTWHRIADTNLPFPQNFIQDGVPLDTQREEGSPLLYELQPHSSILLEARVVGPPS